VFISTIALFPGTASQAAEKGTKGVILSVFRSKTDSQVVETSLAKTPSLLD
jgi:hypothetical protein